jgi:hypothetical protein
LVTCRCLIRPAIGEVIYLVHAVARNASGARWGRFDRVSHDAGRPRCPHGVWSTTGAMDAAISADEGRGLRVVVW